MLLVVDTQDEVVEQWDPAGLVTLLVTVVLPVETLVTGQGLSVVTVFGTPVVVATVLVRTEVTVWVCVTS